jgi:hypothetical protein
MTDNSAQPVTEWTIEEVADWARKVLNFSEKSAKILLEAEVDLGTLTHIVFKKLKSADTVDKWSEEQLEA